MVEDKTIDPLFFEQVIVKILFSDIKKRDVLIPFLKPQLFNSWEVQQIIKLSQKFSEQYGSFPTFTEFKIEIEQKELHNFLLKCLNVDTTELSDKHLMAKIESFFQQNLAFHAIVDAKVQLEENNIDQMVKFADRLREAVSFSFETNIGLDVFSEDGEEEMFSHLHDSDIVVPTGIPYFDEMIEGGFHEKSLSLFLAECVTKDTKVKIRVCKRDEMEVDIGEVQHLLDDCEVEVLSPDGYVKVCKYVSKGKKRIFIVSNKYGKLKCSANHLLFTNHGWKAVSKIDTMKHKVLMNTGIFETVTIQNTNEIEEVVDIAVNHPNHRYYTNGFVSHNTNMGKSLIMAGLAANQLMLNKNVLYVTLEMSKHKMTERVLANCFDLDMDQLKLLTREKFHKKYQELREQLQNKLVVEEFPTKTVSTAAIRQLCKELLIKKGFKPDIVYVDYLGIMLPIQVRTDDNSYGEQKRISEEMRGLAVELGLPIVSAVQTNRGGFDSTNIDLKDTADSIGTAATADIIIGVTQSDEQRQFGKYSWIVLKNRYGINKRRTTIGVNYQRMRIFPDESVEEKKPEEQSQATRIVDEASNVALNVLKKSRAAERKQDYNFE